MLRPEFNFQAFPEHVPCLRLVRVVQLLPGQDDVDDEVDPNDLYDDDDDEPTWSRPGRCL